MTRVVVVGDLMTDTVAHAALPLARGSDTPATVTMHGGGAGANIAASVPSPQPISRTRSPLVSENGTSSYSGQWVACRAASTSWKNLCVPRSAEDSYERLGFFDQSKLYEIEI